MKKLKACVLILLGIIVLCAAALLGINGYVIGSTKALLAEANDFSASSSASSPGKADCILVLGAGLKIDGTPNHMLADRLDMGIKLYKAGAAPKLLLSGDNGKVRYNEVQSMKNYVLKEGIPLEDIFLDHAGFSTYESMHRAGSVFDVKSAIVVTQQYHQYRALYVGSRLGLEVCGVPTVAHNYKGQEYREFREILARNKDFFMTIIKPQPTYLGDTIPISGSGLETQ